MSVFGIKYQDIKITPIVAYGLVFIGVVFAYLCLERLFIAGEVLKGTVSEERSNLAALSQIQEGELWEERLAYSMNAKENVDNKAWVGGTSGVIAAEFQQYLRKLASGQDVKRVSLNVDSEPTSLGDIEILAFNFSCEIPLGGGVYSLLAAIAEQPRLVVISEASFSHSIRDRRSTNLLLSGFIPIRIATNDQAEP